MTNYKKNMKIFIFIISTFFLGFQSSIAEESKRDTYEQLELFGQVFDLVKSNYVEDVKSSELIEAAINGMLSSLDPHSGFLPPKSFDDMQVDTKGSFGGLVVVLLRDSSWERTCFGACLQETTPRESKHLWC